MVSAGIYYCPLPPLNVRAVQQIWLNPKPNQANLSSVQVTSKQLQITIEWVGSMQINLQWFVPICSSKQYLTKPDRPSPNWCKGTRVVRREGWWEGQEETGSWTLLNENFRARISLYPMLYKSMGLGKIYIFWMVIQIQERSGSFQT